jgi:hypothetical protein
MTRTRAPAAASPRALADASAPVAVTTATWSSRPNQRLTGSIRRTGRRWRASWPSRFVACCFRSSPSRSAARHRRAPIQTSHAARAARRRRAFARQGILEPDQRLLLNRLADPDRFDRRQAVVDIVQQVELELQLRAHPAQQLGYEAQVHLGRPGVLGGSRARRARSAWCRVDPVNAGQPGDCARDSQRVQDDPVVVQRIQQPTESAADDSAPGSSMA